MLDRHRAAPDVQLKLLDFVSRICNLGTVGGYLVQVDVELWVESKGVLQYVRHVEPAEQDHLDKHLDVIVSVIRKHVHSE